MGMGTGIMHWSKELTGLPACMRVLATSKGEHIVVEIAPAPVPAHAFARLSLASPLDIPMA